MKEEYKQECAKRIAFEAHTYLNDILEYLNDLPDEYRGMCLDLCDTIKQHRYTFLSEVNAPLIALKKYTDGKCSWGRAGEISGLGYFGLQEYCFERDVDWRELRIDEYYGFTGPKAEEKIRKHWEKLNQKGDL